MTPPVESVTVPVKAASCAYAPTGSATIAPITISRLTTHQLCRLTIRAPPISRNEAPRRTSHRAWVYRRRFLHRDRHHTEPTWLNRTKRFQSPSYGADRPALGNVKQLDQVPAQDRFLFGVFEE